MVLSRRRPRTVLGRLVACRGPVRPSGLGAGWLPGAWWGGGFPGCGRARRGGPGPRLGWPCRLLRGGTGPCRAAPGPVPEPASPHHHCCPVVTGRLRVVLPQGRQPGQGKGNGGRGAQDVAVWRDDGGGEVTVVDVDSHHRVGPQLIQGRREGRGGRPRRVDVPAAAGRVTADVVADRAAGGLGGDLVAAVGERDRAG